MDKQSPDQPGKPDPQAQPAPTPEDQLEAGARREYDTSNSDDLGHVFPDLLSQLRAVLRKAVGLVPIVFYFWLYWRLKDRIRQLLHHGALAVLSVSLMFFIGEIVLKAVSPHFLPPPAEGTEAPSLYQILTTGLIVLAGLVVLWHNALEARERRDDHRLASAIWDLFHRDDHVNEEAMVRATLPIIARAFKGAGVYRVSFWVPHEQHLIVKEGWYYQDPAVSGGFLMRLPRGKGVAGLVFDDGMPRYVPRVSFPFNTPSLRGLSRPFLHALTFTVQRQIAAAPAATGSDQKPVRRSKRAREGDEIAVLPNKFSRDSVVVDGVDMMAMRSFVAIPVASYRKKGETPHGVLCFDFHGTDPLRTDLVRTAAVFGVLLAMDLERFKPVT